MSSILTLKHVTKQFGGLTAVNDLNMEVEEHSIHALIGPNGAGKTTATNMIEGVFPPTTVRSFTRIRRLPESPPMKSPCWALAGPSRTSNSITP